MNQVNLQQESRFVSRLTRDTLALVLAGGAGSRLRELTAWRAKPALYFGGKYRIIDFTLSNCLHSGLRRILVLTQYKSHSLQEHLRDGWSIFNPELNEYITPVPPQMRTGEKWYAGTADAIYQNLNLLEESGAEFVLILSGDHVYRMDYASMLEFHADHDAEPDEVDAEHARCRRNQWNDDERDLEEIDEEAENEDGDHAHQQESDPAAKYFR